MGMPQGMSELGAGAEMPAVGRPPLIEE